MLIENLPLPTSRRFAAGIDISRRQVRLAVLSRVRQAVPVRIEWLGAASLDEGVMSGVAIVDRMAVAATLAELLGQWPQRRSVRLLRCAMAVPGSATVLTSVPLPDVRDASDDSSMPVLDAMAPAAAAAAERAAGLERSALALDWFVEEAARAGGAARGQRMTVAATAREHLQARVEVAAVAGVALSAVDGEPPAALRALWHTAAFELGEGVCFVALWVGSDGVYAWRIVDEVVEAHVRYPGSEYEDLAGALHSLAGGHAPAWAVAGGELELMAEVGFSLADIGDLLGCSVVPFECAPFCDDGVGDAAMAPRQWRHASTFAVAFGLALRGVAE
ncbi:pilus assembly protein PilM [Trinickia fusca]|uniref:Pilus assembly protein PilM n=1 Tax=Trinickia fusca TaxID=2419777 RepID=A0A494X8M8_9BURK|nr:pilus assembly protein PilM [Trinickia fusca]RKP44043.1 pilus assembly protein PilM [Trinickia fusca]